MSVSVAGTGEEQGEARLVAPGTPGAIECKAPGCGNWFVKRSGRHIYCKAPNCTYRRGAPPAQELGEPEGAAAELLRRLQDPEGGGDVGLEMLGPRLRAFSEAQRSGDREAIYGAALDAGQVFVAYADRVKAGTIAPTPPTRVGATPSAMRQQPVGLVHAALASHARTVMLSERRADAIWSLMRARDALTSAQDGVSHTIGTEQSVEAEAICRQRQQEYDRAERTLQSVEAAWQERRQTLTELEAAGASVGAPTRNGGANVRRAAAAG